MHRPDRTPKTTPPSDDPGKTTQTPCPFCGCQRHIEDTITVSPVSHSVHQCLRCGARFDDWGAVCPRCGSPGEFLGNVVAPGRILYIQYRCPQCGQGFMTRIDGGG